MFVNVSRVENKTRRLCATVINNVANLCLCKTSTSFIHSCTVAVDLPSSSCYKSNIGLENMYFLILSWGCFNILHDKWDPVLSSGFQFNLVVFVVDVAKKEIGFLLPATGVVVKSLDGHKCTTKSLQQPLGGSGGSHGKGAPSEPTASGPKKC